MNAEVQVSNSYDSLEGDIKIKARTLSSQQIATGLINTAFGDLLKGNNDGAAKRKPSRNSGGLG